MTEEREPPFVVLGDEDQAQRAAAALVRWSIPFRYEYVGDHVFTLAAANGDDPPSETTERQFRMLVETA